MKELLFKISREKMTEIELAIHMNICKYNML